MLQADLSTSLQELLEILVVVILIVFAAKDQSHKLEVSDAGLHFELNVPPLRTWGINEADLPGVVEKAAYASSMQANPLPLTGEELLSMAMAAL